MKLKKQHIGKLIIATCLTLSLLPAYSQQDSTKSLIKRVDNYYNTTLQEKIFLHTDRSQYLTGETLWFKVYNVDAVLNRPIAVSKVAYVEILDKDKLPVLQDKVAIDGTGSGSIFLPASLASGNYIIRAYTSWMKNFSPEFYFKQPITIINPFVKLGLKPADKNKSKYDVQFFPEGGNFVNDLKSKVAFRAIDPSGRGINCKGAIINENNDTIVTFASHKFGIGHFAFTPQAGHQYKGVIINQTHEATLYNLPDIQDNGYVLNVNDTSANWIVVSITSKLPNSESLRPVYMLAHNKQNVVTSEMHLLQAGATSFALEKSKIKEGITHFTLFDEKLLPVCERLYFKKPVTKIKAEVKSDLNQYAVRKRVKVDINTNLKDGQPIATDLSVAIYQQDLLQSEIINIEEYLSLASELAGNIESPSYYLSEETSAEQLQATDELMMTHGWSRFNWSQVLKSQENFEFIPEIRGHIITGRITDLRTNEPAKNIVAYLSSPQKDIRLYLSRSKPDGKIQFEMLNFYGSRDITVRTNTKLDSTYSIQLANAFSEKYSSYKIPPLSVDENVKTDLEQRAIHMQVQSTFFEKQNNQFKKIIKDSTTFYGQSDKRYMLDDYTRFPTMEEVMREYVVEVMVRKREKKYHYYVFDRSHNSVFNEEPLVMIDGVPVFDTDKVMAFDPRKVKRLDVITRRYFLGPLSFPGVVSYSTYKNDLGGFQPDSRTLMLSYEGLQAEREFYTPRYETQPERASTLPDTRTLLFWSPQVKTGADGKAHFEFYSSDVTGKFNIVVQGLSGDGKPIHSQTAFEVKEKLNY
jgi:hypothetical protein